MAAASSRSPARAASVAYVIMSVSSPNSSSWACRARIRTYSSCAADTGTTVSASHSPATVPGGVGAPLPSAGSDSATNRAACRARVSRVYASSSASDSGCDSCLIMSAISSTVSRSGPSLERRSAMISASRGKAR